MGLDSVELVLEAESTFGVELDDDDTAQVYTVGEYCDLIVAECNRIGDECRANSHCIGCGYSLRGLLSSCCPECGEPVPPLPSEPRFAEYVWPFVVRLVSEQMGVEASSINRSTRFIEDLGVE